MSQLRNAIIRRFVEEMKLRNLRFRTIDSYQRSVEKFQDFLEPTPLAGFSREDLRRYLLFVGEERQLAASSVNVAHMAIRRFNEWVLARTMPSVATYKAISKAGHGTQPRGGGGRPRRDDERKASHDADDHLLRWFAQ